MSTSGLLKFLVEHPVDNITEEIIVSSRLKQYPFTIKGMTGTQFSEYQKLATKIKGKKVEFDNKTFNEMVVLNHTVEPNFRDAKSVEAAGCTSPEQFMYKSLLAGEIAELAERISALSGFDKDMDAEVEEAKNS